MDVACGFLTGENRSYILLLENFIKNISNINNNFVFPVKRSDINTIKPYLVTIITLFMIVLTSASAVSTYNTETNIKDIVGILAKLNNSSHIILSIDCSSSVNNPQENAKKVALEFLNETKRINSDGKFKVGYVGWNDHLITRSHFLSTNLDEVYNDIDNNIKLIGTTCFEIGMNESLKLLRAEDGAGINDIIIIISDGLENCTKRSNFSCKQFKMNNADINIYTIQIGEDPEGSKLLRCLGKPAPKPSNEKIDIISANNSTNQPTYKYFNEMPFRIQTREVVRRDPYTNMTVSKSISGGDHGPRITLKLNAPGIEKIRTNVVIALDSSGSLGKGGQAEYGENIRKSMPEILKRIEEKMPISNVSIISWDNNIDFAYSNLLNTNPYKCNLVPISQARKEISENEVFLSNNDFRNYPIPLNYIMQFFLSRSQPEKYYRCDENESTDLNVGLNSSRIVLNKSSPNRLDGIRKLIIFIAARSEFAGCDQSSINQTKNENCDIHTIGVGVIDDSDLQKELIKIAGNKSKTLGDRNKYHYSPGSAFYNDKVVAAVADRALEQYFKENILNNISIIDTLYPYLKIDNQSINVVMNEKTLNKSKLSIKSQINPDDTSTLKVVFGKDLNMKPSDVIQVSFDTVLDLSLPIDVTNSKTSRTYSIGRDTQNSNISYNWLGNNQIYTIPLPECNMATD